MCMHSCVHMCVPMCECRGWRWTPSVFLSFCPPEFFETGSHTEPGTHSSGQADWSGNPGIHLSAAPCSGITNTCHWAWLWGSGGWTQVSVLMWQAFYQLSHILVPLILFSSWKCKKQSLPGQLGTRGWIGQKWRSNLGERGVGERKWEEQKEGKLWLGCNAQKKNLKKKPQKWNQKNPISYAFTFYMWQSLALSEYMGTFTSPNTKCCIDSTFESY